MSTLASPEGKKEACQLFADGMTLSEVGRHFGVSRQRIHQIIQKVGLIEGGRKVAIAKRAKLRELRRDAYFQTKWGLTYAEWERLRHTAEDYRDTPMGRFKVQMTNARRRGIEWRLTFKEWWTLWQESGKWYKRGRMLGEYVLSRFGDHGPYSVDNVFITTASQNIRSYRTQRKAGPNPAGCHPLWPLTAAESLMTRRLSSSSGAGPPPFFVR